MSEENKTVELKDNDLEKVSGGVTPITCDICHMTFSSPVSLALHKKEKHPKVGPNESV